MVYEVPPFSTNVGELAPLESDIPIFFVIEPIEVKNPEEYVMVEHIDSRI